MRGVIVNAGNANCATGDGGLCRLRKKTVEETARRLRCPSARELFVCSTGVIIGVPLPIEKDSSGALPGIVQKPAPLGAPSFAELSLAICTTEHAPKDLLSVSFKMAGKARAPGGLAPRARGMIHPNMATTSGFRRKPIAAIFLFSPAFASKKLCEK